MTRGDASFPSDASEKGSGKPAVFDVYIPAKQRTSAHRPWRLNKLSLAVCIAMCLAPGGGIIHFTFARLIRARILTYASTPCCKTGLKLPMGTPTCPMLCRKQPGLQPGARHLAGRVPRSCGDFRGIVPATPDTRATGHIGEGKSSLNTCK